MKSRESRSLLIPLLGGISLGLLACGDDDGPSGPGNFPDIRGEWVGQYSVTNCSLEGGSDPLFCDDIFYFGASLGVRLDLDQNGPELAGDGSQGSLTGRVRGEVDMTRLVSLGGTLTAAGGLVSEILAWETFLEGDSLVGSWTFEVEDQTTPALGVATVEAVIKLVGPSVPTAYSCPVELDLAQNDQVTGVLGAGDCQILDPAAEDETYFDLFALDVQVGDAVFIELVSLEFSVFLQVLDVEERALAAAPNPPVAGEDTASLALEAVVTETWLIMANTVLNGETGGYSLVTERINAGAAAARIAPRPVRVPRERLLPLAEAARKVRYATVGADASSPGTPLAPRDRIIQALRGGTGAR